MAKPRPWWQTYPERLWTQADRRAAISEGWAPPSEPEPPRPLDQLPTYASDFQLPAGFSLNSPPRQSRAEQRAAAADAVLERLGISSRRRRR